MPEIKIKLAVDNKKKKKKVEEDEEIYPGIPQIDETLGAPASMLIKFFDLGTKKSGDNWVELDDFFNNINKGIEEEERTLELKRAVYEKRQQTNHYKFIKNKYDFLEDDVYEEFGDYNDKQFERKPLKPIIWLSDETNPQQIKERDDQYRWDGVGVNTPLIHVSLIKNQDSENEEEGDIYRWVNEDSDPGEILVGGYAEKIPENKKNSTRIYGSTTELGYVIRNIWTRKAHLKIQEFGSHSTCVTNGQSWYPDNNEYDGVQIVDMVEGIFWNNFNTYRTKDRSNSEQLFKLTKTPYYDDEEFIEPILRFSPAKTTKVEVYIMPRKWWYYAHFDSEAVIEEQGGNIESHDIERNWRFTTTDGRSVTDYGYYHFYDTKRDPINNYHNVFCIWGRPPHDFLLPRRDDDIKDYGDGKIGNYIPTSLISTVQAAPLFIYEGERDPQYYPASYFILTDPFTLLPGNSSLGYQVAMWNYLMDNGGTFDQIDSYDIIRKAVVTKNTTTGLDPLIYNNYYFAWNDLSYMYEIVKEPFDSAIGCKSSINSLYLYNFVGQMFADTWHSENFYYNVEVRLPILIGEDADNISMTRFLHDNPTKEWYNFRDIYIYLHGWQSPVWLKTKNGAVPHRATRPSINENIGTYVSMLIDNRPLLESPPQDPTTTYNFDGMFYDVNRNRRSFYETNHWVYTPPHGGLMKFGTDFETIQAGRCYPDVNPLTFTQYFQGSMWYYPAYVVADRPLYDATDKYKEEECANFDKIWDKIWDNKLVQDRLGDLDKGIYPADNVPYMSGVGLTSEGSLVAIIKVDSTVYYVWRTKDEGINEYVESAQSIQPKNRFPYNRVSEVPSMDMDDAIQTTVPLYGCLEVWDDLRHLGHIRTFDWKYPLYYFDYHAGSCRHTNSIMCPTVTWTFNSHETFLGYNWDGFIFPWTYAYNGNEWPTISGEEVFELEHPVLLMTYRERARFDDGYHASFFANSNCANPVDESENTVEANKRNRDLYE